jgi:hypothetical protein
MTRPARRPQSRVGRSAGVALVLLVALTPLLGACGASGSDQPTDSRNRLDPRRLYPLGPGFVWTYDVDTGTGLNTLAISRVVSHSGTRFEVSNGSDPIPYEVRGAEGIWRADKRVWLLHAPIQQGASWESALGGRAEVTDVHASVETVEGTFRECVRVRETGEEREVQSVFCPDVGLVYLESIQQLPIPGSNVRAIARLRGHLLGSEE